MSVPAAIQKVQAAQRALAEALVELGQAAGAAPPPAGAPAAAPDKPEWKTQTGFIDDMEDRTGTTKGNDWHFCSLKIEKGFYKTFDTRLMALAESCMHARVRVRIKWSPTSYKDKKTGVMKHGRNLEDLEPLGPVPEPTAQPEETDTAPPAEQEPPQDF